MVEVTNIASGIQYSFCDDLADQPVQDRDAPFGGGKNGATTSGSWLKSPSSEVVPVNGGTRRRVGLVAAQILTQEILARWLQDLGPNFCVTRHLAGGDLFESIRSVERYDLVVVECDWRAGSDVTSAERLRIVNSAHPEVPIVVVSDSEEAGSITRALNLGVRGYIPTTLDIPVATAALRLVLSGGMFAPIVPLLAETETGAPPRRHNGGHGASPSRAPQSVVEGGGKVSAELEPHVFRQLGFTGREAEILFLLQKGFSNRHIAAELGISENTVIIHVRHVMRKLGASNRTQAVALALDLLSRPA